MLYRKITFICLTVAFLTPATLVSAKPQPGDVYKEFFSTGGNWRVTDREAGHPGAQDFLPNSTYTINIDDLTNAIRAEAVIVRWGGHTATIRRRIAFGYTEAQYADVPEQNWINLPAPYIPYSNDAVDYWKPECWMHFDNVDIVIPLEHLTTGSQNFILDCGPQVYKSFNWGQWGFYGMVLRIYYDPASVTHPTGQIISPTNNATITDNPQVTATATGDIAKIDFLAWYDGLDLDGDGIFQEYQEFWMRDRERSNQQAHLEQHLGTSSDSPYTVNWDTTFVPDQLPGSIKIIARIKSTSGIWYVTQPAEGLTLNRPDFSVKLYYDDGLPRNFWVRDKQTKQCEIDIPAEDNLQNIDYARLHWRTWAETPAVVTFNSQSTENTGYIDHTLAYFIRNLSNELLQTGTNTITVYNSSIHHGCEIMYPGPMLTVRYNIAPSATVLARHIAYNNSAWDNYDPAANDLDDNAIATDKTALLPGQTATHTNYTSYDKGINAIIIDIANLPQQISLADFEFHVGNDNTPQSWITAPSPSSVTVRLGEGTSGSDRITLIWPDYAITGQWLKVTIKANANTNLQSDDVFYFGNAVGDTLDQPDNTHVNATDQIACRNDPHIFLRLAPIDHPTDINRDRFVNATDEIMARNNATDFTNALQLITAP